MKTIKNWKEFNEAVEQSEVQKDVKKQVQKDIKEKPNLREEYRKFFSATLKKHGATKLGELDKDQRAAFFREIKSGWAKKKESL